MSETSIFDMFSAKVSVEANIAEILKTVGSEIRSWNEVTKSKREVREIEKWLDSYTGGLFINHESIRIEDLRSIVPRVSEGLIRQSIIRVGGQPFIDDRKGEIFFRSRATSRRDMKKLQAASVQAIRLILKKEGRQRITQLQDRIPQIRDTATLRKLILESGAIISSQSIDDAGEEVYELPTNEHSLENELKNSGLFGRNLVKPMLLFVFFSFSISVAISAFGYSELSEFFLLTEDKAFLALFILASPAAFILLIKICSFYSSLPVFFSGFTLLSLAYLPMTLAGDEFDIPPPYVVSGFHDIIGVAIFLSTLLYFGASLLLLCVAFLKLLKNVAQR